MVIRCRTSTLWICASSTAHGNNPFRRFNDESTRRPDCQKVPLVLWVFTPPGSNPYLFRELRRGPRCFARLLDFSTFRKVGPTSVSCLADLSTNPSDNCSIMLH